MVAGCRLLAFAANLTERERATVARLGRAADRMSRMVTDIVGFARAAAGNSLPIRPRPTNLTEVLSEVIDEIGGAQPDRRIDLSIPGELLVTCDSDRIAQAVANLVVNALEHGQGPVSISAESCGEHVLVEVHNDGRPIPADSIPGLFDPFVQKAEHSAGLGLGLYIVREIVRGHGGSVEVHSSPAQGTTFALRWPRSLPEEPHAGGSDGQSRQT
jgi:signal transduction histidine kinase